MYRVVWAVEFKVFLWDSYTISVNQPTTSKQASKAYNRMWHVNSKTLISYFYLVLKISTAVLQQ